MPHKPKSVPIKSLIYQRGSVWWFRRRIPQDLVKAKAYGKAQDVRKSLKTSSHQEAESLAHLFALELQEEWEQKRRELNLSLHRILTSFKIEIGRDIAFLTFGGTGKKIYTVSSRSLNESLRRLVFEILMSSEMIRRQ